MGFVEVLPRSDRNNAGRVNGFVATEVVIADVIEIDGLRNAWHLVDITQKTVQIQVVTDAVFVALEVGDINRIKTYQRGPQANIGLG